MREFRSTLFVTQRITPKRIKHCSWLLAVVVLIWLVGSLVVAHRLTRRRRAPFAEPAPTVAWGAFESTRLSTRDGQKLGAWYAEGKEEAASVLLLHGNGGRRGNCLDRAQIFAAEGCSVLLITLRAHGDSTGQINDIGLSARHDVVAAVDFLERRRPGRPVVVLGTSMGAAAAIFASGELAHRVSGYILESPYEHLRRAVRNRTETALPPLLDWVAYQGLLLASYVVLPDLDAISPVKSIEGIPPDVPVLILAGGADRKARPQEAKALHRRVKSHGRLILFEKAGHLNFLETDGTRYRRSLIDFVHSLKPGTT
ncbi:Lysophospholipase, alpha-beta hydrolase superfamily [Singulisphaera sp. GP187]|uniref:alpha/beta hydrolase n=1 Tax=Singulisphaera sp. GP187 TaxID=1882752 RepID=UPI00092AB58E|nr:alpha/beta fold hydrolase [Singulisphaera sp. GP187]SIO22403.1 Lysophospholipase, alpha-beta hydrolase superfamily [Singulisphaera sp. GP187]